MKEGVDPSPLGRKSVRHIKHIYNNNVTEHSCIRGKNR